jgi:hypothetical protein
MKGNQGLEALAALCGGQTDAPTEIARRANKSREEAVAQLGTSSHGTQQSQPAQASVLQPSQRQNPSANQQQSALQNVTQQQWQQAIAAAAALQGGGVNPALAAQSFLMSGGLSQHNQGENTFSTMQQLAFHQYVQAQANHTAQQASQLSNQAGKAFGDQGQQAIMRAFATGNAQQLQQVHGKLHYISLCSLPRDLLVSFCCSCRPWSLDYHACCEPTFGTDSSARDASACTFCSVRFVYSCGLHMTWSNTSDASKFSRFHWLTWLESLLSMDCPSVLTLSYVAHDYICLTFCPTSLYF